MQRINVTGTSCSGKTTLARRIAERLDLPYVEMDALFWGRDWTPVPTEAFRRRVAEAASGQRWVIDGSYSSTRDITWARADTVVWLDYPMPVVLWRWARRTIRRIRSGDEFWPGTGNRETLRHALRADGLPTWIVTTHRARRRRTIAQLAARPELTAIRLCTPAAAERWLASLSRPPSRVPRDRGVDRG